MSWVGDVRWEGVCKPTHCSASVLDGVGATRSAQRQRSRRSPAHVSFFFCGNAERNRHTTQPVNSQGTSWPITPPREGLQNRARNCQHPRAHVARAWVPQVSWRKTLRTKRRAFASTSTAKRGNADRWLEKTRFPCSNCRQIVQELGGFRNSIFLQFPRPPPRDGTCRQKATRTYFLSFSARAPAHTMPFNSRSS